MQHNILEDGEIDATIEDEEEHLESNPADSAAEESFSARPWPLFRFDIPPLRTYHFAHQFQDTSKCHNFFKGVKWSPDGFSFLTSSEDQEEMQHNILEDGEIDATIEDEEEHLESNPADSAAEESFSARPWPLFRFDIPPLRTYHFDHQFQDASKHHNFFKDTEPDTLTVLLTDVEQTNHDNIPAQDISMDDTSTLDDAPLTVQDTNVPPVQTQQEFTLEELFPDI
ncbi:hypothetical protein KSP40_PGU009240 [Platanthera guangdongensis]|uniref:Uncharacterized protein n=1 Tax=Platanthera guangdongensis TaxID=2320717 RepID=A0ABR2MWC0_9ASPA